jgi:Tfp pilus assembly PilM family ATPase
MFTIGLSDKSIKFLEVNNENKISFAHNLTENINLDNLFFQNKFSENYLNKISEQINDILSKSNTSSNISKLLIETNYYFTNVIPLDFSSGQDKINSNILWELSNYFPESYKNYKITYHKLLSELYSENVKGTLIIAVKNSIVKTIKKLSKLIDIKISSIDVEHFSSEKYFRAIRKYLINDENILIIGCKNNRFDFSIINNSGCLAYDYFLPQNSNSQDLLAKAYIEIEDKYINLQINNVYLYGDELTSSSYKIINDISKKARVILSNPFYEIGITDNLNMEIVSEGYKFIPLCGLALD